MVADPLLQAVETGAVDAACSHPSSFLRLHQAALPEESEGAAPPRVRVIPSESARRVTVVGAWLRRSRIARRVGSPRA